MIDIGPAPQTFATRLATWTESLEPDDVPADVARVAHRCIIDTLGVALAGSVRPAAQQAAAIAHELSPDAWPNAATLLGSNKRCPLAKAAFANAFAAHTLDYDDTCFAGILHGSAVVFPALLSVAETTGSSMEDFVTAFVAASEVAYTIGEAVGSQLYESGWFPTGCIAGIGAAAGAAKLYGLDAERIRNAIALAACQTNGLRVGNGTDAKAYLVGRTAELGVESALASQSGINAPTDVFEGANGFFQLIAKGEADLNSKPGVTYKLLDPGIVIKQYPLCSSAQPAVEALLGLIAEHQIETSAVESVHCRVAPMVAASLPHDAPANTTEALFSLPFALACAMTHGTIAPSHLNDTALSDPAIKQAMRTITHEIDTDIADIERYPEAAHVSVRLSNETHYETLRETATGDPRTPMSDEGLLEKFRACAAQVMTSSKAEICARRMMKIKNLNGVQELLRLS